jgi:cobalt-zinc-cadmium efflux system outer membrane protein
LPPNPTVGYENDNISTGGGPGYVGGFIDQVIKTAGKLKLAQAAAVMDLRNAELALRKAEADLATQVRSGYFTVLVARENVRVAEVVVQLTDAVYRVMVLQLQAGEVATYEPMQLRVVALQARGQLVQARNRYQAAWKQLAATLGLTALPLTELAGRVDMPIPRYHYDEALAHVLSRHTDVQTAENGILKARYNLKLAQVTPIPDVDVRLLLQQDHTTPPFNLLSPSVQVSVPVPIWDRNQGGIHQAQGQLLQAVEDPHRVRSDLTSRLAEAFGRYESNRVLLNLYRTQILPNQVQAFRAAVIRHSKAGDADIKGGLSFNDLVTAEQTLVSVVTVYVGTLGDQWTAVVDVSGLLQTDDLFQIKEHECVAPVPDLEHLLPLPCCHPCSPLPDPVLKGANGSWTVTEFDTPRQPAPATKREGAPETAPAPRPPSTPPSERPAALSLPALSPAQAPAPALGLLDVVLALPANSL